MCTYIYMNKNIYMNIYIYTYKHTRWKYQPSRFGESFGFAHRQYSGSQRNTCENLRICMIFWKGATGKRRIVSYFFEVWLTSLIHSCLCAENPHDFCWYARTMKNSWRVFFLVDMNHSFMHVCHNQDVSCLKMDRQNCRSLLQKGPIKESFFERYGWRELFVDLRVLSSTRL